ncbi:hypothetical protein GGI14_005848, partial [Coemansia sp. S680]
QSLEPRPEDNGASVKSALGWSASGTASPVAAIAPAWQGRKTYTSSTLQQRRTTGVLGGTSPRSPSSVSPSPLFMAAAARAEVVGDGGEPTSGETVRALGSVTAQVSTMAAQCIDLLLANGGEESGSHKHLATVSAALYTVSRAWQDEVVRSSSAVAGGDSARPREMSEADLRVVLRDLDAVYIELSKLQR